MRWNGSSLICGTLAVPHDLRRDAIIFWLPSRDYLVFNLFNYIKARAAGAMLTALLLAFVVGPSIIARLKARKIGQVIRPGGLASHQGSAARPPWGRSFSATVIPTPLWAR